MLLYFLKATIMLIRVVAENFRSYGEETEFNMLPSSNIRRFDWHVHSRKKGADVLRTAVIYGANGAGKSGLIRAIGRLQEMVIKGSVPPPYFRDATKFNDAEKPVTLEMEFGTEDNQYSYGVSYKGNTCVEEWLYSTIGKTPTCIFERKHDEKSGKIRISLKMGKREEAKSKLLVSLLENNLMKNNELMLSKHDMLKNKHITEAYNWMVNKLVVIDPETHSASIFDDRYSNNTFKLQSEKLITALDLGINALSLRDEGIESFKAKIKEWPELIEEIDQIIIRFFIRKSLQLNCIKVLFKIH